MPAGRSVIAGWFVGGLLLAWLASPVAASTSSPTRLPGPVGPVGPRSGAMLSGNVTPSTGLRSPSLKTLTPPPCDGKFDVVASPNSTGQNVLYSTVAISANDVWAVGLSTNASNFDRTLAEHWNGTSWTIFPTPNVGTRHNDLLSVTAISSTNVWAVGAYQIDSLNHAATLVEHWNGTSWSLSAAINPSSASYLEAVTPIGGGNLIAVGTYYNFSTSVFNTLIEVWDQAVWAVQPSANAGGTGVGNQLFGVSAFNGNDMWAVGSSLAPGVNMPLQSVAEHFDGFNWNIVATPNLSGPGADSEIVGVTALEANHAVGVGYGGFVTGSAPRKGAAWDLVASGTSTAQYEAGPGTGDNVLTAVARSGAGVQAVGYSRSTPASALQTLAIPATWDSVGHTVTWGSVEPSDNPSSVNNVLFGVTALSPHVFWAAGYEKSGTTDHTLTELYCGVHLNVLASGTEVVGAPFSVTVTAVNASGAPVTGYLGTVHFTSTDPLAVLPGDYTFTPSDGGTHVFNGVVLNSPYTRTITVNDTVTPIVKGSTTINVVCSGACQGPTSSPGSRSANQSTGTTGPGPRIFRGRDSGAFPLTIPSSATRSRAAVSLAPVACDGQFDVVASPNATGNNVLVSTAVIGPNDVWAVGSSSSAGHDRTLAEHWNGSTWTIVAVPNPGSFNNDLTGVSAVSATDVWAVGSYQYDSLGNAHTFAEHWNGTSWALVSTLNPVPYALMFGVTAVSSSDVWAVGTYDSAGLLPLVEHWDGSTWNWITVPNPSPSDNELLAISAWSATDIWAVGEVSGNGSGATPLRSLAEHWDGAAWSVVATPNLGPAGTNNEILGVAALEGGHAVGVGYGNLVNGSSPRRGEAWDLLATGTSTSTYQIGPGAGDNALLGVARSGSSVWAGGYWRNTAVSARQTLAIPATWDSAGHTLTWGLAGSSASPSPTNNALYAVAAVSPSVFWATGWMQSGTRALTLTELYCGVHFNVVAPGTATQGTPFSLTVNAMNADSSIATHYVGTVHFSSTDSLAVLPGNYTFIPGDSGSHTFSGVVLNTPYSQTITVIDTYTPFIKGSRVINVVCSGACQGPGGTPGSRGANQSTGVGPPGTRLPAVKIGPVHGIAGVLGSQSAIGSPQGSGFTWSVGLAFPLGLIMFALQAIRR